MHCVRGFKVSVALKDRENANAFVLHVKRVQTNLHVVRSMCETHVQKCRNASLGVQNGCAHRPKHIRSACETRLPYTLCLTGTVCDRL